MRIAVIWLALTIALVRPALADGAKSPEDAVKKLESAVKAADTKVVAQVYGGAVGAAYKETCDQAARLGAAKKKLRAALDAKFGKKDESFAGLDDATIKKNMKRTVSMTVANKDGDGDRLALAVTVVEKDGGATKSHDEALVAEKGADGWHVYPEKMKNADAGQAFAARIKRQAEGYERVAGEVKDGKYATRDDARAAAEKSGEIETIKIAERGEAPKPDRATVEGIELAFTVIVAKAIGPGDDDLRAAIEELALPDPDAWFAANFDREGATFAGWYSKLRPKFVGDFTARVKDAVRQKRTEAVAIPASIGARLGCKVQVCAVKLAEPGTKNVTELCFFAFVDGKVRFVGDLSPPEPR